MFSHTIKSKAQQFCSIVQSINLIKKAIHFSIFKKTKTGRQLQFVHASSKTFYVEKKSVTRIYPFLAVIIVALFFVSCQKEELSDPILNTTTSGDLSASASGNTPPRVDAGSMKRIVYPTNTATLTGSGSDAEGSVTYKWTQTSGPSNATIAQPTKATTDVSNLKPGVYTFLLTVTDKGGKSRTDSTNVTVLQKMTWTISGVTREALVHPATGGSGQPAVIFAFHGHGGTDLGFAERAFEVSWPEAIVVYPQGLPTQSHEDKAGKSAGWQHSVGEVNNRTGIQDQDIKFFDAMLSTFNKSYNANMNHIFVHGWSNGGDFVYNVLWTARGSKLAALAPAAVTLGTTNGKVTVPVIHTAGTKDPTVRFSNQQQTAQQVRTLDKCSSNGTKWATGPSGLLGTHYSSSIDAPEVFLQYDGGHSYPFTVPAYIVKFFKEVAGVPAP